MRTVNITNPIERERDNPLLGDALLGSNRNHVDHRSAGNTS